MKKLPPMNLETAKAMLGVSRQTVLSMLAKGHIKGKWKPGGYRGSWNIDSASVHKYLEKT